LANAFFSPPGPWRRPSATFDRLERQLPRPGRLPGAGALGTSVQHPLGSSLTARAAAGPRFRTALSVYDFSGDLGKVALPGKTALLIALWQWRVATVLLGPLGTLGAANADRCRRAQS
jgi:hypothetical protein